MSDGDVEQPGQISDEALIARACRGGAEGDRAFEQLYFRHRDFVLRVARRFTAADEQAVDAAQERQIDPAHHRHRFKPLGSGMPDEGVRGIEIGRWGRGRGPRASCRWH